MKPIEDVVACVADKGLFLHIAQALARKCKGVYYFSPWEKSMCQIKDAIVGDGYPDIIRADSIWEVKDKVDCFVFPDCGFEGEQKELRSQGLPVWGSGDCDRYEVYRGKFLDALRGLKLPVPKHTLVRGLTNLRVLLKDREDVYIKTSRFRGDMETTHWRSWELDEGWLEYMAMQLGPAKEVLTFYVFDAIETTLEDGVDTFCINGQLPKTCIHGMECKDRSYLGTAVNMDEVDDRVTRFTHEFSSVLNPYANAFSTEVRLTDEEDYFIDPTLRFGIPPSQVMVEMIDNLPEIIWSGANGELVEPEYAARFGVQAVVESKSEDCLWTSGEIPKEIQRWFKMPRSCQIGNKWCISPDPTYGPSIGWLVALGDSIQEAIDTLKAHASELPKGWTADVDSIASLIKEIQEAQSIGLQFTEQKVPKPATVIDND